MIVPLEILELILLKCDGKTLLAGANVSETFKNTIEYLGKKTKLWEWCCKEDIPEEQLVEYLQTYEGYDAKEKWRHVYYNWGAWEQHDPHILSPKLCTNIEVRRISAIAVSNKYIAVGSEDGRLKVYTCNKELLFVHRIVAVKLSKLTFIGNQRLDDSHNFSICLVVAFNNGLSILSYDGLEKRQYDILDVISHSVFGKHVCIEKVGGRMTIVEINKSCSGGYNVKDVWFTRIYSPTCTTTYNMWNGKCTFLINDRLCTVCYKSPDITPMMEMTKGVPIKFHSPLMLDSSTTQILRDNVIINIYKNAEKSCRLSDAVIEDYVEIVILKPNKDFSIKMFNTWEIFSSNITSTFLYGNTLLFGTSCGSVYFYRLQNWKNFDMKNYTSKQIIGKHPIISMAVKETETERKFYVCSKFAVHEIVSWIPLAGSST
ncbi:uncharacterized protein LOC109539024 [Dendroctonus ponderosae]|uniref:uncharacterized protein LOC109539024 n=1 Tax=Dendroctonus ponderosae TaxID=77166 RepID=UPI00203575A6|nr:uncharacterized protein LOC109539024 [Dendroctonus ponderosae]